MKVFVDTHILIDCLLNADMESAAVISNIHRNHPKPVISSLSIAILNYFIDTKYRQPAKKRQLAVEIMDMFEIATPALKEVPAMLKHKDWEDAFQYYSARQANSRLIVTSDLHDYYFSTIELISPEAFNNLFL